ncbi:hypothetical protein D3C87_1697650 [compost metagenome]
MHALGEKLADLPGDILILRIVLHIARLAQHVHQTNRQPGGSSSIQGTIASQRTHIVDQARTQARCFSHDGRR